MIFVYTSAVVAAGVLVVTVVLCIRRIMHAVQQSKNDAAALSVLEPIYAADAVVGAAGDGKGMECGGLPPSNDTPIRRPLAEVLERKY